MTFDQLLAALESATSLAAKDRLVREFANAQVSPIIEETRATFFYLSEDARQVALEGDWTNWQPTAPMAYLPDTALWYRVERFPRAARLEYRGVVNGARRLLDPRNPRVAPPGFGPHSEVVMPDYRAPRELDDVPNARGVVEQHWMTSRCLGPDRRTFWVYLPPQFQPQHVYPVAYFNDGDGYLHYAHLPRLADSLIARGEVEPFIAVLLKPNDRAKEYARSNPYVRFLVNELIPWIDSMYPTRDAPRYRALIGTGLGGLGAAHAARRRPNVFGLVGAQSGYYSYQKDALLRDYAAATKLDIRFHLVVGEFETDLNNDGRAETSSSLGIDFVAAQRRFADLLRNKGYDVFSAEYPEGHQWGFWRAHLGDMLRFFWGRARSVIANR